MGRNNPSLLHIFGEGFQVVRSWLIVLIPVRVLLASPLRQYGGLGHRMIL
jgi:hypothetical protein